MNPWQLISQLGCDNRPQQSRDDRDHEVQSLKILRQIIADSATTVEGAAALLDAYIEGLEQGGAE